MRVEGWESRLAEALRDARPREFDPKAWNCALFCRACVEAITSHALPRRLSGTLEETVDALFPRVRPSLAQRGDVVLMNVPQPSLGIAYGRKAAFVTASGLTYYPMRKARIAWSV
jgi:hypothetical protein